MLPGHPEVVHLLLPVVLEVVVFEVVVFEVVHVFEVMVHP